MKPGVAFRIQGRGESLPSNLNEIECIFAGSKTSAAMRWDNEHHRIRTATISETTSTHYRKLSKKPQNNDHKNTASNAIPKSQILKGHCPRSIRTSTSFSPLRNTNKGPEKADSQAQTQKHRVGSGSYSTNIAVQERETWVSKLTTTLAIGEQQKQSGEVSELCSECETLVFLTHKREHSTPTALG